MNAPLTALQRSRARSAGDAKGDAPLAATMAQIGRDARAAARLLALAPAAQKNRALAGMAKAIRAARAAILAANNEDREDAKAAAAPAPFLDRLTLDRAGVEAMADGIDTIRKLKDP